LDADLRSHRITVSLKLRDGLPELLGNRGQLYQVLLNLIMNAIEAMHSVIERGRVLLVRSEFVEQSSTILIAVQDSGTGIDRNAPNWCAEPVCPTKLTGT